MTNTTAFALALNDFKIDLPTNIYWSISIIFIILLIIFYKTLKTINRTMTKQSGNTYIIGVYFTIFNLLFTNLFFVLEFDWKYILLCILCYAISYQSFKQYKK
jgi:putative membrane protein